MCVRKRPGVGVALRGENQAPFGARPAWEVPSAVPANNKKALC